MNCKANGCKGDNRKRNCQCYALSSASDARRNQKCMVEEDGVYYECEAGCCHEGKGCPGQCSDVDPSPPYRVISHSDVYTTASVKYLTTIQIRDAAFVAVLGLCLINMLLFVSALLKKTCHTKAIPANFQG